MRSIDLLDIKLTRKEIIDTDGQTGRQTDRWTDEQTTIGSFFEEKKNTKKSFAIKYGKEVNDTEYVLLGQNRINWVDSVKHNYVNLQLSDSTDCMMKRSTFVGSVNKPMANFGHLQALVLSKIFKTFCCNFYESAI